MMEFLLSLVCVIWALLWRLIEDLASIILFLIWCLYKVLERGYLYFCSPTNNELTRFQELADAAPPGPVVLESEPPPLLIPQLHGDVEVRRSEELGRHVVAVKPIGKGSVVILERAIAVGVVGKACANCTRNFPSKSSSPLSGFFSDLKWRSDRKWSPCRSCGVPLCSADCTGRPGLHTRAECALLATRTVREEYEQFLPDWLTIVRVLMLPPEEKRRVFLTLESNDGRAGPRSDFMKNAVIAVEGLSAMLGDTFSREHALRAACIVQTNAFDYGAPDGSYRGHALFVKLSMFSHSCVANARFVEYGQSETDFLGAVVANSDIPAGGVVSVCYVDRMPPTRARRAALLTGKLFLCRCERCEDPAELGLHTGSVCCPRCQTQEEPMSLLLPHTESARSERGGVLYRCSACAFEANQSQIDAVVHRIQCRYPLLPDPDRLEGFVREQLYPAGILHPTFHVVLGTKFELVEGVYGHAPSLSYKEMSESQLRSKLQLCRELLDAMAVAAPGHSLHRGYLLLETIPTLLEMGRRHASSHNNPKKQRNAKKKKRQDRAGCGKEAEGSSAELALKCRKEAQELLSELALIFSEPLKKQVLEKLKRQIQNLSLITEKP